MPTVREAAFRVFEHFGVDRMFGNPGSTELPMLKGLPFPYVQGLNEAVVVAMADGYARATGRASLVNLHSSAGTGHSLGNLFTAYKNNTPLVVTAGQQARSIGRGPVGAAGALGQPDGMAPATGVGDAGAQHQRRPLGLVEHRRKELDPGRVGHGAQVEIGKRRHLALAIPVVDRDRDEDRAHRRRERGDEGADQRQRRSRVLIAGRRGRRHGAT